MKYADVVIDTKSDNVDNFFTYEASGFPDLKPGARVKALFGLGKGMMSGYVFALRDELPPGLEGKRISKISEVDDRLSLNEDAIPVCVWMRSRYYCRYIEAASCFAPPGAPRKRKAAGAKAKGGGGDAEAEAGGQEAPAATALMAAADTIEGWVHAEAGVQGSPATTDTPAPAGTIGGGGDAGAEVGGQEAPATTAMPVASDTVGGGGDADGDKGDGTGRLPARGSLTQEQRRAAETILPAIEAGKGVFLLHGVTGSGKTEVYLAAAEKALALGRKAIMLVPEISLTHQTVRRFVERFGGDRIAILHSKLTLIERHEEWLRIKEGAVDIVIGARSAVFAPFSDIGLIVVDEEHESSYKSDMSPKYDTVEVAVKRAAAACATVLLGSATPSVVSSYRAEQGLYTKLVLTKRYNATPLPLLAVADMRAELLKGNKSIFSEALYKAVNEALAEGKQAMLFLNRRGWSSYVSCTSCGYVMKCERCNISLTWHKAENRAVCHYCGAYKRVPDLCPSCGKPGLRFFGVGTEQVEDLTKAAFPDARVARLDADNARKRGSGEKILSDFGAGRVDILIGTQMIAKGLDFPRVTIVGIIAADISLNIPDFKSPERTFQLITQVAGRAGRREERGRVFIQTYIPENYAIMTASDHDYEGFYRTELFYRKTLCYPPFSDVIQITSYSEDEEVCREGAERVRRDILAEPGLLSGESVLGPRPAPIAKIENDFRYHLYLKAETKKRKKIEKTLAELKQKINIGGTSGYRIIIDVNPYSFM